ncbi:MAG: tetratricopeptide repeat protein [bacterium]|nr:tetratricopeptide repeat protein [bacterium]
MFVVAAKGNSRGVVKSVLSQNDKVASETALSRALLKQYPADTKAHMEANIRLVEDAIARYGNSDPWAAKAFCELGHTRYLLGKYEEALSDFDSCLKLPEPYVGVHFAAQNERMQILQILRRPKEAIAASKELDNTSCPPAWQDKFLSNNFMVRAGIQAQLKGQKQSAIDTYRLFIKAAKNKRNKYWQSWTSYAYRGLADQLVKTGNVKEAISVYDEFLKQYPDSPASALIAMKRLRLIKCGKEQCILSKEELLSCIKLYPTNTGAGQHVLYELAMAYTRDDKLNDAAVILNGMLIFKPKQDDQEYSVTLAARASLDLSDVLKILGKDAERERILLEIMQRFPDLPEAKIAKERLRQMRVERIRRNMFAAMKIAIPIAIMGLVIAFANRKRRKTGISRGASG